MLVQYHMQILSICLLVSDTVFSIFNLIMHIAHTLQAEILVPVVHWPQIVRHSIYAILCTLQLHMVTWAKL